MLLGVGATHALSCVVRVVLDAGDDVLVATPYWPLTHGIVTQTGARVVTAPHNFEALCRLQNAY